MIGCGGACDWEGDSLSLWQGWDSHPTPLSLQNGYINFDKRRKVRGVLGLGAMSQEGESEGKVRAPAFGLLQSEGPFLGICCPF